MRKYDNIALLFVYSGVSLKYILNTVAIFYIIFLYRKTLLVQTIYYFLITNV